jgi:hypothetical protein
MNTTETNLIFEAYAKSKPLNEGYEEENAEDYGTAYEDLPLEDLFDTALAAVDDGHGLIESLMLAGASKSNIDELFPLFKEYVAEQQKEFGSPEDNENSGRASSIGEEDNERSGPSIESIITELKGIADSLGLSAERHDIDKVIDQLRKLV